MERNLYIRSFFKFFFGIVILLIVFLPIFAKAEQSPVGNWLATGENGQVTSLIKITEKNNQLSGKIVKFLIKEDEFSPGGLCAKCPGELKNKPIQGMTVLWGFVKDGNSWAGGSILDRRTGNIYNCELTVSEDGKELNVHAYKGVPIFGKTIVWKRAPK